MDDHSIVEFCLKEIMNCRSHSVGPSLVVSGAFYNKYFLCYYLINSYFSDVLIFIFYFVYIIYTFVPDIITRVRNTRQHNDHFLPALKNEILQVRLKSRKQTIAKLVVTFVEIMKHLKISRPNVTKLLLIIAR